MMMVLIMMVVMMVIHGDRSNFRWLYDGDDEAGDIGNDGDYEPDGNGCAGYDGDNRWW